jgi:hypothetical protein
MAENQEGLAKLFSKIATIQGELGAVKKDATHQQNYKYHSADAVMGALNPLLTKHNLIIIPNTIGTPQVVTGADGLTRWVIDYEFVIACGDTGANFTAHWSSEGVMSVGREKDGSDRPKPDDKSMGKTHTYALKYWLIHLFKVTTKDTADLDQNHQDEDSSKPARTTPQVVERPDSSEASNDEKYTAVITKVDVKLNKHNKPFINAGGITFNNRDAFRTLGYAKPVIDSLEKVGAVTLPDGIVIAYVMENGFKKATMVKRVSTDAVYEVAS